MKLTAFAALAVGATFAATVAIVSTMGTAWAHAEYDSSTPASGAVVATAPTSVVITFKEEIQATAGSYGITVTDSSNASATSGPAVTDSSDATKLSVPLKSGLADGRYVVRWNNTSSDDGDALNGAFSFYIGTQPTSADLAADQELAAIEENALATATAEAAGSETPAAAASPASAPSSQPSATSGGALPTTGDGSSGGDGWKLTALAVFGLIAAGSGALIAAGARARR